MEVKNYLKNIVEQLGRNSDSVTQGAMEEFIKHVDTNKDGKVCEK